MLLRSLRRPADPIERSWDGHGWAHPELGGGAVYPCGDRGALALPAFYRGTRIRSGLISTLPLVAEVGDRRLDVVPPILAQPDPTEDLMVTLSRMASSLSLRGEVLAVLGDFDDDGFPQQLKVVDPADAHLDDTTGVWTINGRSFARDRVLHQLAFALAGETRGLSVVEQFRQDTTGELAARRYQRGFYESGGAPTAVVKVNDQDVPPEEMERLAQKWANKLRGRREPMFLPAGVEVEMLGVNNRDAQFLEGRRFALTDIAHIVGLPAYYLGAEGSKSVYANISDERRDLLDIYLRDDLYAIERGLTGLLPDGVKAKFAVESFLRLDPRGTAEQLQASAGWMLVDEQRAVVGLPPLPDGAGQVLAGSLVPGAAQPTSTEGADTDA